MDRVWPSGRRVCVPGRSTGLRGYLLSFSSQVELRQCLHEHRSSFLKTLSSNTVPGSKGCGMCWLVWAWARAKHTFLKSPSLSSGRGSSLCVPFPLNKLTPVPVSSTASVVCVISRTWRVFSFLVFQFFSFLVPSTICRVAAPHQVKRGAKRDWNRPMGKGSKCRVPPELPQCQPMRIPPHWHKKEKKKSALLVQK